MTALPRLLAVARGDEPADLLLRHARLVDVLAGEVRPAAIAVADGRVAAVAGADGDGYRARREVDLGGLFVAPGFLDAHVHVESSLVPPAELSRAAYAAAGIRNDHESTGVAEARAKLRAGLTVFLREATNARNLRALLPLVSPVTERRLCLCTDDRQPADLLAEGSIDHLIRVAIAAGVEPLTAIRLGTLNTAEHYGLADRGAVAPGRRADLVVFPDLAAPCAQVVFRGGEEVARDGFLLRSHAPDRARTRELAAALPPTVHVDPDRLDFRIPAAGARVRVIGVVPDQLLTESLEMEAAVRDGQAVADPARDLLKMAVVERHHGTGRTGLGFVRGVGLREGAIAGTVAHDHHNLVVIGADDAAMLAAARAVAAASGGLAVARGGEVLALLPLPIAGLMSDRPIEEVRDGMRGLTAAAHALGARLRDPFMAMSFLALEVIPALKLTDVGLVDVERLAVVPLFV